MLIANLKEMIGRAVGAVPTEEPEPDLDLEIPVPNRREQRRMRRSHYKPASGTGYHKPRSRTGSPDWFRGMKVRAQIKAALIVMPISALHLPEADEVALLQSGVANIWTLSQAKREDLLAVKGIGPAKLKRIRAALVSRSVPVAWKAE